MVTWTGIVSLIRMFTKTVIGLNFDNDADNMIMITTTITLGAQCDLGCKGT